MDFHKQESQVSEFSLIWNWRSNIWQSLL